jgi:hypothetical protein
MAKCREMALGFNAHLHPLPMHINTLYSTFNATKWLNAWGMGWAMLLLGILNGIDALYGVCGCVGSGLGLTRLRCAHGNRAGLRTGHIPIQKNSVSVHSDGD